MSRIICKLKEILADERGITTVEVILLLVVIIAVIMIFKDQIIDLVEAIMEKITKQAMRI